MRDNLLEILASAEGIAKTAYRHSHSLSGNGYYGTKFSEHYAKATLELEKLKVKFQNCGVEVIKDSLLEIQRNFDVFFNTKSTNKDRGLAIRRISFIFQTVIDPAMEATPTHSPTDDLFPLELVRDTRGYIERIAEQSCGSYDQGWYDACAVMIRRLLETLIIEVYEQHKIENRVKQNGDYLFLGDLINKTLSETTWNLTRNTKNALPKLKDIGDKSAHSRRFMAIRQDIDKVKSELRTVIQELLILAKLK